RPSGRKCAPSKSAEPSHNRRRRAVRYSSRCSSSFDIVTPNLSCIVARWIGTITATNAHGSWPALSHYDGTLAHDAADARTARRCANKFHRDSSAAFFAEHRGDRSRDGRDQLSDQLIGVRPSERGFADAE